MTAAAINFSRAANRLVESCFVCWKVEKFFCVRRGKRLPFSLSINNIFYFGSFGRFTNLPFSSLPIPKAFNLDDDERLIIFILWTS